MIDERDGSRVEVPPETYRGAWLNALALVLVLASACGDNENRQTPLPQVTTTPSAIPTVCPARIELHINGVDADFDVGSTGLGYDVPLHEGIVLPLDAECGATASGCGTCALTASTTAAAGRERRRCAVDVREVCGSNADCPSGPCVDLLGPPLGLTTGGASSCTRNEILAIGTGTYDPSTGSLELPLTLRWTFYSGIDVGMPCPRCSGAALGAAGVCAGGPHDGEPCVVDATDALFGNTSYDCSPHPGADLGFFDLPMDLTTGNSRLEPSGQCTAKPFVGLPCYCPGQTVANLCTDGMCDPSQDGEAVCRNGPVDRLCVHEYFRGCFSDADCPAEGDSCGFTPRKCSSEANGTNGIVAPLLRSGEADPHTPVLVSTFCVAGAASPVPNEGLGLPGPAGVRLPVTVVRTD